MASARIGVRELKVLSDVRCRAAKQPELLSGRGRSIATRFDLSRLMNCVKLPEWGTLRDAIPTRFEQALAAAAKFSEPKAKHVKLPGGTIRNENELSSWLSSAEQQIRGKLKDGPVIL